MPAQAQIAGLKAPQAAKSRARAWVPARIIVAVRARMDLMAGVWLPRDQPFGVKPGQSKAKLSQAMLSQAMLSQAMLSQAMLSQAMLSQAMLSQAMLSQP